LEIDPGANPDQIPVALFALNDEIRADKAKGALATIV
jgi:hypothetical protein